MIRQIWRGCGTLPHVGEHPGTASVLMFIAIGAVVGGLIGAAIIGCVCAPLYLHGAYERAKLSDKLEQGNGVNR